MGRGDRSNNTNKFRRSLQGPDGRGRREDSSQQLETEISPRFAKYVKDVPRHGHTTDAVTHILREAILDGALEPSSWLREAELAQEMSVSRTPVREALRHLSIEGLVTITAHQGAIVAPLTMDDTFNVYVVRETLEGLAARLAAKHRTQRHVQQLYEALEEMDEAATDDHAQRIAEINIKFHKVIREATGNPHLDRFLGQIEHFVRRFRRTTFEVPGRPRQAVDEHRSIADAIAAGDPNTAEKLAIQHMRVARELRVRMVLDQL